MQIEETTQVVLTQAQQKAAERLLEGIAAGHVFVLWGAAGMGKTTILQDVQAAIGGALVSVREFLARLEARRPLAVEEAFMDAVRAAMAASDIVIVDDLHLVASVVGECTHYPRAGLIDAAVETLLREAAEAGKKLVFGSNGETPDAIVRRAYTAAIQEFEPGDYASLCAAYLEPQQASNLDYATIHRFARKLNAHQLKSACVWLRRRSDLDTDQFVEYLRSMRLTSNVDLAEVQQVDLRDLKGLDDIIQSLEANIVLPLENDALASEFGLKPKRGVLLAGPPGTGKTTVGRALAHRLKGKFFLVDGTFIAGTSHFYDRVVWVFDAAKQNAPSVIFIDDTDVIFESGEESGLYRYLLTVLDGLESESAGGVCVMMTAMDVGCLPPAMVRSGRIELWLETRLPDEAARTAILADRLRGLPDPIGAADPSRLAASANGLSGADLKRVVEDGKTLFAYDKSKGLAPRPADEYFLTAIETVRANKRSYEDAESRARERRRTSG